MWLPQFNVECVAKIFVLGNRGYFRDGWNRFDFVIVLGSNVSFVLSFFPSVANSFDPTILRFFRIARIFRLVKRFPMLMSLLMTLFQSLSALLSITLLMLLLFFVYAVVGISLFGEIPHDGDFFNDDTNFDDFYKCKCEAISHYMKAATCVVCTWWFVCVISVLLLPSNPHRGDSTARSGGVRRVRGLHISDIHTHGF
jgi:hypothetical protein